MSLSRALRYLFKRFLFLKLLNMGFVEKHRLYKKFILQKVSTSKFSSSYNCPHILLNTSFWDTNWGTFEIYRFYISRNRKGPGPHAARASRAQRAKHAQLSTDAPQLSKASRGFSGGHVGVQTGFYWLFCGY